VPLTGVSIILLLVEKSLPRAGFQAAQAGSTNAGIGHGGMKLSTPPLL